MVETIKGVSIQGKCFETRTDLVLLNDENNKVDRIALIYGKNGSGKSAIASAFSAIAAVQTVQTDVCSQGITASLIDANSHPIQYQYNDKAIHVFNEEYIDRNIRVQTDGLGSIVMLGQQVDLQDEIDDYTTRERDAKKSADDQIKLCNRYNSSSDSISPKFRWEAIKTILKKPGGWAEEDSRLRSFRQKSSVTEQLIKEICTLKPGDIGSVSDLKQKLSEKKATLSKIRDTTNDFTHCIKTVLYDGASEELLCTLLAKKIDEPILTRREQEILAVIQGGQQTQIENAGKSFSKPETVFCPYCFQAVDEDYKTGLLQSIRKVLHKDVDDHKNALAAIMFPYVNPDYSAFSELDAALVVKIQNAANKCVNVTSSYKELIKEKTSNTYTPVVEVNLDLNSAITALNTLIEMLETKRLEFIEAKGKRDQIIGEAIILNKLIAHESVQESYKEFLKSEEERKKAEEECAKLKKEHEEIHSHLHKLLKRKANTLLAVDKINKALEYIFFKKERLEIEQRDAQYFLKSNGHDVKPCDVSLGERNAIALCYFFIDMFAEQEIENMYRDEMLVVIDDPVSSFDIENRVGIISYLRYQTARVIKGNTNSRVIILTHDITTEFDLIKAASEICKQMVKTKFSKLELMNGELKLFIKNRSEYKELLKAVYNYANAGDEATGISIGNMMRRALEAFATFVYQKNSYEVSCDPAVLTVLANKSDYFENLMCRLVLNGESHFEEQVYSLRDDGNLIDYMSDAEKIRTAKDVLSFMYLLNKQHIEAYLKGVSGAVVTIQTWSDSVPINTQ